MSKQPNNWLIKIYSLILVLLLVVIQPVGIGALFATAVAAPVPVITAVYPSSVANNYNAYIPITVTAENTNFILGQSQVEVLDSNNQVTTKAGSVTASTSQSQLTFTLNTGLNTGQYKVRVITGSEVVTSGPILTVRGTPSISLSKSSVATGYDNALITVNGVETGFSNATIVTLLTSNNISTGKASTPMVSSGTSLSFTLAKGLDAGDYIIKITTGSEEAAAAFQVLSALPATVALNHLGDPFSVLSAWYNSAKTIVLTGTNTGFTPGTTAIALFDPDNHEITSGYIANVAISSGISASFILGTGLQKTGTYKVRISTGDEVAEAQFELEIPQISAFTIASGVASGTKLPQGYADTAVSIAANDSTFTNNTTVEVLNRVHQTTGLTIKDAKHLSFVLKKGLTAGTYTVQVDVDGDISTTTDQINQNIEITAPLIAFVTPNSILNTSAAIKTITVTGVNTHFLVGTPVVNITGVDNETITTINAVNDTTLSFNLIPSSISATGVYGIQVTTTSGALTETVLAAGALTVSSSGIQYMSSGMVYTDELGTKIITVVGNGTSFRPGTTGVQIDAVEITNVNVTSPISLKYYVPASLGQGNHVMTIDQDGDGNTDYTTSFLVAERSISLTPGVVSANYADLVITVTSIGITFDPDSKTVVKISKNGQVVATINNLEITEPDAVQLKFPLPKSLAAGKYLVQVSWSGGANNGISLGTSLTVNPDLSTDKVVQGSQQAGGGLSVVRNQEGISSIVEAERTIAEAGTYQLTADQLTVAQDKVTAYIRIDALAEKMTAAATIASQIIDQLAAGGVALNRELVIKATVKLPAVGNIREVEARLPAGLIAMIEDYGIDKLIVQTPVVEFVVTSKTFGKPAMGKAFSLAAKRISIDAIPAAANSAVPRDSVILDLTAVVGGKQATEFAEPIEVSIPYVLKAGGDPDAVTVFILQDDGTVKPVGGRYDVESGRVTVRLGHFSKYFVKVVALEKFNDLNNFAWAARQVEVLAGKGIISGRSESEFDPKADITRAEFAALLVRMLKLKSLAAFLPFEDVQASAWYAEAVAAAYDNELVAGKTPVQFDPQGKITRQEIAVMLTRVLTNMGYKPASLSELDIFTDKKGISSWAKSGVAMAVREGLVTGMPDATFGSTENANRAQAAVMLYRLFNRL